MLPFGFHRSRPILSVFAGLSLLTAACLPAHADSAPRTIGFMGVLNSPSGPYQDGPAGVKISLYSAATGGDALWSENQTVTVSQGVFSTVLGSTTPFPASLDFSQPYFVGVKVGDDAEMAPRFPLAAVPYALFAHNVAHDAGLLAKVSGGAMASDGANIGIGTSAPAGRLDIVGGSAFDGSGGAPEIAFEYGGGGYRHFIRTRHNGSPGSGNAIDFFVNNSSDANGSSAPGVGNILNLTLDSGRVGIGTSSPAALLDVKGKLYVDPNGFGLAPTVALAVGDTDTGLNSAGDGALDVYSNNNNAMSFRGELVGVGTTSPTERLTVNGRLAFQQPAGDQVDAGKLDYRGFDANSFSIVGAGTEGSNRNVRIWDSLSIGVSAPPAGVAVSANGVIQSLSGGFQFPDGTTQTTAAGGSGWSLSGNAGVGNGFLGTTDGTPLVLKVNGYPAVKYQYTETGFRAVNVLGGAGVNTIASGVVGATIAGGGFDAFSGTDSPNSVQANFGAVGGGFANWAQSVGTTVAGGTNNQAGSLNSGAGYYAAVGGGTNNSAFGAAALVGGGSRNVAQGDYSTVTGGNGNFTYTSNATVAGGTGNYSGFSNTGESQTVGGGNGNKAHQSFSTVAGGTANSAIGLRSVVAGGGSNTATADDTFVGGGSGNTAISHFSTIAGGDRNSAGVNTLLTGDYTTVGGGSLNAAALNYATVSGGQLNVASGQWSVIPGGRQNKTDADYAFAAGYMARAAHRGAFVWADSSGNTFTSTGPDQFLIQAGGGVGINTNNPAGFALNVAGTASVTNLTQTSDARFKTNVRPLAHALSTISALQGVTFDWRHDGALAGRFPQGRQVGFIAQEVETVLPEVVNTDRYGYKSVSYQNIVPVLVQGMKEMKAETDQKLAERDAEIAALRQQNADLNQRLSRLEARLASPASH